MWRVWAASDAGTKYHQAVTTETPEYARSGVRQEDAFAVHHRQSGELVVCVADGHGSSKMAPGVYKGGRESADAACAAAVAVLPPAELFYACDASVRAALSENNSDAAGTTLSVLTLRAPPRQSTFSWVGDSVGVLVRERTILPIGAPHSVHHAHDLKRMIQGGARIDGKYFVCPTGLRIAVSRSLGHSAPVIASPETASFVVAPGDRVVVASDGLWDACNQRQAGEILMAASTEQDASKSLMHLTRSVTQRDNVTIVVVFVHEKQKTSDDSCCVLM